MQAEPVNTAGSVPAGKYLFRKKILLKIRKGFSGKILGEISGVVSGRIPGENTRETKARNPSGKFL